MYGEFLSDVLFGGMFFGSEQTALNIYTFMFGTAVLHLHRLGVTEKGQAPVQWGPPPDIVDRPGRIGKLVSQGLNAGKSIIDASLYWTNIYCPLAKGGDPPRPWVLRVAYVCHIYRGFNTSRGAETSGLRPLR